MTQLLSIPDYQTFVFDCDGVVLNSNQVKTEAFYLAALPYGKPAANAMVEHHVANGGISRYRKFSYFLEKIVPQYAPHHEGPDLETLLHHYAAEVRQGLMDCEVAPGLHTLRKQNPGARWLIVSGGDQTELRDVFARRGLAPLFNAGIFGSPDSKDEILSRELATHNIEAPALFLGDSKYDFEVSLASKLDFIFLTRWTEVKGWKTWADSKNLTFKSDLRDLLNV